MEYLNLIFASMLNAGIAIPALMIGYYLSIHKFRSFFIPAIIYSFVDHILVQLLYIAELQQNAFYQLGTKISEIDWSEVFLKHIIENISAFFIITFIVYLFIRTIKKLRM